jgi:hypothetical protein
MLIPAVDEGLEALLRSALPLPPEVGEVSFEQPSGGWSAQLSRVAVNLFLYGAARSPLPPVGGGFRVGADGAREERTATPLIELQYLISAWASTVPDEHRLLGDVLGCLLAHQTLPGSADGVRLTVAADGADRPRDLWSSLDSPHKASFTLVVTAPLPPAPWQPAAPPVQRVEGRTRAVSAVTETGRQP